MMRGDIGYPAETSNAAASIAFFSLVALAVTTQTAFKLSQTRGQYEYNTVSAMCVVEGTKLLLSLGHHWRSEGASDFAGAFHQVAPSLYGTYSLLALSYAVYNQLIFVIMQVADPGTFSLVKSFTPIFVSLLNCGLFGQTLTQLQWFCVLIQVFGIIPVITTYDVNNGAVKLGYERDAVLLMMFVCLMASLNTVFNASVVKKEIVPIAVQNSILYAFGVVVNTIFYFLFSATDKPFFHGYQHPGVILLLALNSFVGIAITIIYKYGDAVLKTLSAPLSSAFLVYISYLFFDAPLDVIKAAGAGVVIVDTLLYLKLSPPAAATDDDKASNTIIRRQSFGSWIVASALLACSFIGLQVIGIEKLVFDTAATLPHEHMKNNTNTINVVTP